MTKKKARSDLLRYDWEEALRGDLEEALIEFEQLLLAGRGNSNALGRVGI